MLKNCLGVRAKPSEMGGRGLIYCQSSRGLVSRHTCGAASCRAAQGEAAPCVQLPRGPSSKSSSIRAFVQFSNPIFRVAFGGHLVLKIGHVGYRWKALEVYFPMI